MDATIIGNLGQMLMCLHHKLQIEDRIKERYAVYHGKLNGLNQINVGLYGSEWMDENAFPVPPLPEDVVYDSTEPEEMVNSGVVPEKPELGRITADITQAITTHSQWIQLSRHVMSIYRTELLERGKDLMNNLVIAYTRNWQVKRVTCFTHNTVTHPQLQIYIYFSYYTYYTACSYMNALYFYMQVSESYS